MGKPQYKRKQLHFKSIELFTKCILKYFQPIVTQVLAEEKANYGGLETVLNKFQAKIYQKLEQDYGSFEKKRIKVKPDKKKNQLSDDSDG